MSTVVVSLQDNRAVFRIFIALLMFSFNSQVVQQHVLPVVGYVSALNEYIVRSRRQRSFFRLSGSYLQQVTYISPA